jgi:hypothetical protein
MAQTLSPWDFGLLVTAPCADISFSRLPDWKLRVVMHFSHVVDGMPDDLELGFDRAHAMTWHEEALHSVSANWPKPLPKLSGGKWNGWTYPVLEIQGSEWVGRFDYMP